VSERRSFISGKVTEVHPAATIKMILSKQISHGKWSPEK